MYKTKPPKTALEALLQSYGTTCNQLYMQGVFPTPSSVYGIANRDIRVLKVENLLKIGNAVHLNPGEVLNRLLELQRTFPARHPLKNKK